MNINKSIELTPHTLRHAFATYHAENGLSLPILAKMIGHASVRTTALYWQNIYQEPDNDNIGPILAGKNWLERQEPPKPPITENFPQELKSPDPVFIDRKPLILNKKPIQQCNSLSTPKTLKKTPGMLVGKVSQTSQEKFLLDNHSKKSDQLKIAQPLSITSNQEPKPTKKEQILLQKIKLLEEENNNLKAENQCLKELVYQKKQRTDQLEIKLKAAGKFLYQLKKINYYQQLEQKQEAKIEQPPPWKGKK